MKKIFTILAAVILCLPVLALAESEEGYYSRSYARINAVSGDVYVQRAGDRGYEAGSMNLPVSEGDKLGTREGRVEIQLGGGNYLRADRLTQVEFAKLPHAQGDPYKLHLLGGSIYLRVDSMDTDKAFEVHTPDASFYVLEPGVYRLDLLDNSQTVLRVVSGSAEAAGEGGSVVVHAQQRIAAADGRLSSSPESFAGANDDFGQWNESRDALTARAVPSQSYLPSELEEYGSELDQNGTWNNVPDYGNVWVPRISDPDWRPYSYGHWVWFPVIGWTWVSDEPWGWCTYHYGRWGWDDGFGWFWAPTRYWGPAWVNWWWNDSYFGWCPLNFWNEPCYLFGRHFDRHHEGRFWAHENRAWTVINRNQLQSQHLNRLALNRDALSRIGQVSLSGRQPGIAPSIDRNGRLSRDAQGVFSAARVRSVGRAFGTDSSIRGSIGRTSNLTTHDRVALSHTSTFSSHSGSLSGISSSHYDSLTRNIRTYPSRGTGSGLTSGGFRSFGQNYGQSNGQSNGSKTYDSRGSSYSRIREYGSSSAIHSNPSTSSGSSVRSIHRDLSPNLSSSAGRTIREFRSNESSPVSRFRSSANNSLRTYSSRGYSNSNSYRSASPYGGSGSSYFRNFGSSRSYSPYSGSSRSYSYSPRSFSYSSPYGSGSSSHHYSSPSWSSRGGSSYSHGSSSHSSGSSHSYSSGGSSHYSGGSSHSSSSHSSSSSHGHH